MSRALKLVRYGVKNANVWYMKAFRIRIEATDAEDMSDRVFVYQREPVDPYTGNQLDLFCSVAGPVDMSEYPPEEPPEDGSTPFFRKNFIEVDVRSTSHADELWEIVKTEVCNLIDALDRLETLEVQDESQCGTPTTSESSSASSSEAI